MKDDFNELQKKDKPREISLKNDLDGLTAIHRFGWLRPREIGNVLWVNQKNKHISGARVCKRWLDHELVIQRKLPLTFGFVYVLSQKGADFLNSFDVDNATTGKRIGTNFDKEGKFWVPTLHTWQHDLLTNGFLTYLLGSGFEIRTEKEIEKHASSTPGMKIPDGLFKKDNHWYTLEVERSRKSGEYMRRMCTHLIEAEGERNLFNFDDGFVIVERAAIGYEKIETGKTDHLSRIKPVIESLLKHGHGMNLTQLTASVSGGGVTNVVIHPPIFIGANVNIAFGKSLLGGTWGQETKWHGDHGPTIHFLEIDKFTDHPFRLSIYKGESDKWFCNLVYTTDIGTEDEIRKNLIKNFELGGDMRIEAAQQKATKLMLEDVFYKNWFFKKWFKDSKSTSFADL